MGKSTQDLWESCSFAIVSSHFLCWQNLVLTQLIVLLYPFTFLYVRNVSNLCLIVNETFNDLSVTFNFCLLVCHEYVLMDVCKITLQSLKI